MVCETPPSLARSWALGLAMMAIFLLVLLCCGEVGAFHSPRRRTLTLVQARGSCRSRGGAGSVGGACLYSCSCPCHCSPTPLLPYSPAPVPPERTASATSIFDSRVRAPTAHCTMCTGYCALLLGTVCCALCALYWVLGMACCALHVHSGADIAEAVGWSCM
jgi:hypothetical protein